MFRLVKLITGPYSGLSKDTWKFLMAGCINATGMTLTIYLTLYLNALHFPLSKVGMIITFFGVGGVLGGYLGGRLSDKFSALGVCKFSLLVSSGLIFIIPINKNFYYLSGTAALAGLFFSLFRPAFILTLANEEKPSSMEKIIALRRVAVNLGMALGAGVLGLVASVSYSILFYIIGTANLVAFMIIKKLKGPLTVKNIANNLIKNKSSTTQSFYLLLILMFLVSLVFNQTQITYPLYLKNNLHVSVNFISILFTLNGLLIVFFQMPITHYLSNKKTNYTCALGAFLLSTGFSILPFCINKIILVISCSLWTLGEIIFYPAILVLIIKFAGAKKGKSVGLYQLFYSFATFAAPAVGTISYGYDKNLIWYASGLLGLVTIFYFLFSFKNNYLKFSA